MSWKVVISLLHTSNLNYSCSGGLALIGHNHQDTSGAPCCWGASLPLLHGNLFHAFCRCQVAKAILWVCLFFPCPRILLVFQCKRWICRSISGEGLALQRAVQVQQIQPCGNTSFPPDAALPSDSQPASSPFPFVSICNLLQVFCCQVFFDCIQTEGP